MNSKQEKLINNLTEHSMGADFVFAPNLYSKGSKGKREPADIVWACNNCIILMTMTKSRASSEKMFKHNMGQLKGWLRIWKTGEILRGNSHNTKYEIAYHDFDFKILISVVDGRNATAEYHNDLKNELNNKGYEVTACITIPQLAMVYLAHNGGSTRDLLNFIKALKESGKSLNAEEALNLLKVQHKQAFDKSGAAQLCLNYETDDHLKNIIRILRGTRASKNFTLKPINGEMKLNEFLVILNDLSWFELISICYTLQNMHSNIISVPIGDYGARACMTEMIFPPYQFILSVAALDSSFDKFTRESTKIAKKMSNIQFNLNTVMITLLSPNANGFLLLPIIAVEPRVSVSATEQVLLNW